MKYIKGKVCKDRFTKVLVQKIDKNDIAVIKHKAIDLVVAQDLKYKNVKTVINCEKTIDINSILDGVRYLVENNINIYDASDKDFFNLVNDGDIICIKNNSIYVNNIFYTYCTPVLKQDIFDMYGQKRDIEKSKKIQFVKNTMSYMDYELDYYVSQSGISELDINIDGREVLIVSRGREYRQDLNSIKKFIKKNNPVLIGIDGGADALTDIGLKSDIIVGDMDSISDNSLLNCSEILVHTYSNGYAPGLGRVKSLSIKYKLLKIKGTSEDAAIYMAKLKGASKIYLIGSHSGIDEFVEKGRNGMGSTLLLRILYGSDIVDLKGINRILRNRETGNHYLKASIVFVFTFLIIYTLVSYNNVLYYIKENIGLLFNMNIFK